MAVGPEGSRHQGPPRSSGSRPTDSSPLSFHPGHGGADHADAADPQAGAYLALLCPDE